MAWNASQCGLTVGRGMECKNMVLMKTKMALCMCCGACIARQHAFCTRAKVLDWYNYMKNILYALMTANQLERDTKSSTPHHYGHTAQYDKAHPC